jgi:apolipoprotein N-acyltransferase
MRPHHFFQSHRGDFFAFVAGILYTLAFAPFNHAYLILLALMLLFFSWQQVSPKRALLRGYLFGLGEFGLGLSWVYISIHDFGHASVLSASTLTVLFFAFWALFPALVGFVCAKLANRMNRVLAVPALWLLVEYLRGHWVLNGFPWLLCGYSQLDTALAGYIPLFGVYGASFIVALTASLLLALMQHKHQRLKITLVLMALWAGGGYLQTLQWTEAIGTPLRVALIQGNINQDKKWRPENKINTLQLYKKLTEQHWDANIIVWPETSIPAYLSDINDSFLMPLDHEAKLHNADLIVSLPIKDQAKAEKYNAVMTLGKNIASYHKRHLLPFGETMPWQPVSGFLLKQLTINLSDFTAGDNNQVLLNAGGYPFITLICYEAAFGDYAIDGLDEAAYLVNVTNDAWFGDSIEPYHHLQIARMRALETGRYLLRSANTGWTAIIAPNGKIIQQLPLFEVGVLSGVITPMTGVTPYALLGDTPVIYFVAVLLLGLFLVRQNSKTKVLNPDKGLSY